MTYTLRPHLARGYMKKRLRNVLILSGSLLLTSCGRNKDSSEIIQTMPSTNNHDLIIDVSRDEKEKTEKNELKLWGGWSIDLSPLVTDPS